MAACFSALVKTEVNGTRSPQESSRQMFLTCLGLPHLVLTLTFRKSCYQHRCRTVIILPAWATIAVPTCINLHLSELKMLRLLFRHETLFPFRDIFLGHSLNRSSHGFDFMFVKLPWMRQSQVGVSNPRVD